MGSKEINGGGNKWWIRIVENLGLSDGEVQDAIRELDVHHRSEDGVLVARTPDGVRPIKLTTVNFAPAVVYTDSDGKRWGFPIPKLPYHLITGETLAEKVKF